MRLYIQKKDRDALVGAMGSFENILNDKSSSAEEKQTAELQIASISGALLSPLFPTGITRNVLMLGCFLLGFLAFLTPYEWLFWFFFIALTFSPRIVGELAYLGGCVARALGGPVTGERESK